MSLHKLWPWHRWQRAGPTLGGSWYRCSGCTIVKKRVFGGWVYARPREMWFDTPQEHRR